MEGWTGCGSTGEFAAMIAAQRRMVVEIVVDWTAERVPVAAATAFIANWDSECKAFAAAPIPLNGDPDPVVTVGFDFAAGCYRFGITIPAKCSTQTAPIAPGVNPGPPVKTRGNP